MWRLQFRRITRGPQKWNDEFGNDKLWFDFGTLFIDACVQFTSDPQSLSSLLFPCPQSAVVSLLISLVAGSPPRWSGIDPGSSHLGTVVDRAVLGQVPSEYVGFPCPSLILLILHNHHRHHHLPSKTDTAGRYMVNPAPYVNNIMYICVR
jgi:hypothetical protein